MNKEFHKIPLNISSSILTIGPDYINHRGGIGAVLEVYSKYFENFKFLATHRMGSSFFKMFFFLGSIFMFLKLLTFDREIKIIHIHGASYGSFYRKFIFVLLSKYLFRKKVIYHIHGARFDLFYEGAPKPNGEKQLFPRLTKILVNFILKRIDLLICLSNSWESYFINCLKISEDKVSVLNNVVDNDLNLSKTIVNSPIQILFLGEIGPRKGVFDLLEVFKKNKESFKDNIVLKVGGNGDIEKFKLYVNSNKIGHLVEYIGWVGDDKKDVILSNSDILILPSYAEGLPISLLEGMSYGLPIISTNVGGIPEIVYEGVNGKLVEPGNLTMIEDSISFFLNNPNEILKYGEKSLDIVNKFKPDYVFPNLMGLYVKIL
jgi:glycosyltransferase involved in cell wall biosynthesis